MRHVPVRLWQGATFFPMTRDECSERGTESELRGTVPDPIQLCTFPPSTPHRVTMLSPQGCYSTCTYSCTLCYCNAGSYSSPYGRVRSGVACTSCPSGKYASSYGATSCPACPSGKYRIAAGGSSCTSCPAGYYCPSVTAGGSACPAGYYCPASTSTYYSCPAGKYASSYQSSCSTCPAVRRAFFVAAGPPASGGTHRELPARARLTRSLLLRPSLTRSLRDTTALPAQRPTIAARLEDTRRQARAPALTALLAATSQQLPKLAAATLAPRSVTSLPLVYLCCHLITCQPVKTDPTAPRFAPLGLLCMLRMSGSNKPLSHPSSNYSRSLTPPLLPS